MANSDRIEIHILIKINYYNKDTHIYSLGVSLSNLYMIYNEYNK